MKEFIEKVKAGGNKDVTAYFYPGEGHGFMNGGEDIHKMMKSESLSATLTAALPYFSYDGSYANVAVLEGRAAVDTNLGVLHM